MIMPAIRSGASKTVKAPIPNTLRNKRAITMKETPVLINARPVLPLANNVL